MSQLERDSSVLGSPFGRVFARPEIDQVINCAMGLLHPVDVPALKAELLSSVVPRHPRFSSLLVGDPRRSTHLRWQKTNVDINNHIVVVPERNAAGDNEAAVNAYLADLAVSAPLSTDKPLWEVHVLVGLNCIVLRVHHTVGDGVSLMSLLDASFGKAAAAGGGKGKGSGRGRRGRKGGLWGAVKSVWYTAANELALAARIMGVRDEKTVVSGGEGVEAWPRSVSTAKFNVDDMKEVKKSLPDATMNDVLLGVVSCGLAKYLEAHSPNAVLKGIKMTSLVVANIREQSGLQEVSKLTGKFGSSWGNKIGIFLVPIDCRREPTHPLRHVTRVKAVMDRKKQSFEAHVSHSSLGLSLSYLGPKASSWFYRRMLNATTLLISNIVGPQEEIVVAGNPVSYIKTCISSLSQAMTLHLVSYKGRADLQVSVAMDIIRDGDFLAKCFEEALVEMKNAARHQ